MDDVVRQLRASRLFGTLSDELIARFALEAVARRYAAGDLLWRAGDEAKHFTVVERGLVEIRRPVPGGEGTILGFFGPHESVADFAVLERTTYPADAIAISDSLEVLRIRAAPVLEMIERDPHLARAMNASLQAHIRLLRAKIDVMSAGAVPRRLATLWLHLIERFGDTLADGTVNVAIILSRGQLARLVGARTETVIRTMTKWQREGWLESTTEGMHFRTAAPLKTLLAS